MKPYYEHGGITIYHADCREILPRISVDVILSDPPYGVGLNYGAFDDSPETYWKWFGEILPLMRMSACNLAFTHRQAALKEILDADKVLVWRKTGYAFGYAINGWISRWEPIFVYGKPNGIGVVNGASWDLFECATECNNGHPAPKPTELFTWLAKLWSGSIADPFCGSGTTLVAAKNLGRSAIGIEIEEKYCELSAKRLSQEVFQFGEEPR